MLTMDDFRYQSVDKTPYGNEQVEFVLHVCNTIGWPWDCVELENLSISTENSAVGIAYVLKIAGLCYMTTLPADILDHRSIYEIAHGSILLTGLGLGLGVLMANQNPHVDSIVVVENNHIVLETIVPMLEKNQLMKRVEFICADANEWEPGVRFDFAYIDHDYGRANSERYQKYASYVVNWYDERMKLEETWR